MPACEKCGSPQTKILAVKPPRPRSVQIILCQCLICQHHWEQWKPIDLDLAYDAQGIVR